MTPCRAAYFNGINHSKISAIADPVQSVAGHPEGINHSKISAIADDSFQAGDLFLV